MRNLKKFLAVIMTVAMIASLMVPALAAGSNEDEAEALKTIGLFKGTSDTDLALERPLTRDQGVTLVVRILGKEDEALALSEEEISAELAKMADAAAIPGWARPYVAFALKEKIANGVGHDGVTSFDSAAPMTGKHFTTFVLRALGYADVDYNNPWDTAVEAGVLTAGQTITLAKDSIIRDDAVAAIYGAVKNGVLADGKTKLLDKLIADGAVDEDAAREAGFITVPKELEVEDVKTTNLKQATVEFNDAELADPDELADKANYVFTDSDDDDIEVSDAAVDGDIVVLTLETAADNEEKLDLTIDANILGEDTVIEDIEFFDEDIPEVVDAQVVGESTVKVTFSEPIDFESADAKDAFEFDDGDYYVKEVEPLSNNTVANVKLYSTLEEGDLKVKVDNILEDYAGFNVKPATLTISVVKDEEEPEVVGFKDASRSEVTLIFNEDIVLDDDVTEKDFYHTNSSNTIAEDYDDESGTQLGAVVEGNELTLYFDKENQLPEGTAYIYIDGESLYDLWGNENSNTIRYQVEIAVDELAPEVDEIEVVDEDEIKVKFNEKIDGESVDEDDFTLLDDEGDEQDLIRKAVAGTDFVRITFKEELSGDHSLVVEKIKDEAGNTIDKTTVDFTVDDKTAPVISEFKAVLYFDEDSPTDNSEAPAKLVVNFGEAMSVEGKYSVVDLEKYELNGTELSTLDDVKIKAVDGNKAVEITIPEDDAETTDDHEGLDLTRSAAKAGGYKLTIARVEDAGGNRTAKYSDTITVSASGTVAIDKVEATAVDKIKVIFTDKFIDFDYKDIAFYTNFLGFGDDKKPTGDKVSVAGAKLELNDDGNSVATYTLADDINHTATVGATNKAISAIVVGNESVNRYKETLEIADAIDDAKTVADKIAPELLADDDDHPGDEGIVFSAADQNIVLTFAEPITAISDELAATDLIVEADNDELVANEDYTLDINSDSADEATLALINDYAGFDGDVTVSTRATVNYIEDESGNKLAEIDGREVEVKLNPGVEDAAIATEVTTSTAIKITFTEELATDGKTAVENAFGDAKANLIFTWDGDVVEIVAKTETVTLTTPVTVGAEGLVDLDGNKNAGEVIIVKAV